MFSHQQSTISSFITRQRQTRGKIHPLNLRCCRCTSLEKIHKEKNSLLNTATYFGLRTCPARYVITMSARVQNVYDGRVMSISSPATACSCFYFFLFPREHKVARDYRCDAALAEGDIKTLPPRTRAREKLDRNVNTDSPRPAKRIHLDGYNINPRVYGHKK